MINNVNRDHASSAGNVRAAAMRLAVAEATPQQANSDMKSARGSEYGWPAHRQSEIDQIILQENVIVEKVSHAEPPTEAHNSHNSCQVSVADDGRDEPFHLATEPDEGAVRDPAELATLSDQSPYLNTAGSPARERPGQLLPLEGATAVSSIEQIYGNLQEKSNDDFVNSMGFMQEINQEGEGFISGQPFLGANMTGGHEDKPEGIYYYTDQMMYSQNVGDEETLAFSKEAESHQKDQRHEGSLMLARVNQAVQSSLEQSKAARFLLQQTDDQIRESAHSSLQRPILINSRDTMQSVSIVSHGQDVCEDTETVEQRLRLLGEMPSSSSGGTLGRVKYSDEAAPHMTNGKSGGSHSIREVANGSVSQTMMGSGIFEFHEQSQTEEQFNHQMSHERDQEYYSLEKVQEILNEEEYSLDDKPSKDRMITTRQSSSTKKKKMESRSIKDLQQPQSSSKKFYVALGNQASNSTDQILGLQKHKINNSSEEQIIKIVHQEYSFPISSSKESQSHQLLPPQVQVQAMPPSHDKLQKQGQSHSSAPQFCDFVRISQSNNRVESCGDLHESKQTLAAKNDEHSKQGYLSFGNCGGLSMGSSQLLQQSSHFQNLTSQSNQQQSQERNCFAGQQNVFKPRNSHGDTNTRSSNQPKEQDTIADYEVDQNVYLTTELIKNFPEMSASSSILMNESQQTDVGQNQSLNLHEEGAELLLNHHVSQGENSRQALHAVECASRPGSAFNSNAGSVHESRATSSQKRRRTKGQRRHSSSLKRRLRDSERQLLQSQHSLHNQSSSTLLNDVEGDDLSMEYYTTQEAISQIEQVTRGLQHERFIAGHLTNIRTCAHTMMTTFLRLKNCKNKKALEIQKKFENYQEHKDQVNEIVVQLKQKYEEDRLRLLNENQIMSLTLEKSESIIKKLEKDVEAANGLAQHNHLLFMNAQEQGKSMENQFQNALHQSFDHDINIKKVHKELDTMRKEIESKNKSIACQRDQLSHMEKLNEIKQQQVDSIFQQLVQKQELVNQMKDKMQRYRAEAEELLKDKTKLLGVLETKDTLETQNEILRHLEGLIVDFSQVQKSSVKSTPLTLTHNSTFKYGKVAEGFNALKHDSSKEAINKANMLNDTSQRASSQNWDQRDNLQSGEYQIKRNAVIQKQESDEPVQGEDRVFQQLMQNAQGKNVENGRDIQDNIESEPEITSQPKHSKMTSKPSSVQGRGLVLTNAQADVSAQKSRLHPFQSFEDQNSLKNRELEQQLIEMTDRNAAGKPQESTLSHHGITQSSRELLNSTNGTALNPSNMTGGHTTGLLNGVCGLMASKDNNPLLFNTHGSENPYKLIQKETVKVFSSKTDTEKLQRNQMNSVDEVSFRSSTLNLQNEAIGCSHFLQLAPTRLEINMFMTNDNGNSQKSGSASAGSKVNSGEQRARRSKSSNTQKSSESLRFRRKDANCQRSNMHPLLQGQAFESSVSILQENELILSKMAQRHKDLREDFNAKLQEKESIVNALQAELDRLHPQLKSMMEQLKRQANELDQKHDEVAVLNKDLEAALKNKQIQAEQLKNENSINVRELESKLQEKDRAITSLTEKAEREKQRLTDEQQQQIAEAEAETKDLKEQIEKVTDECEKLRQEHARIAKENVKLTRQYDDVYKDNSMMDSNYGKSQMIKALQSKHDKLEKRNLHLERQVKLLEKEKRLIHHSNEQFQTAVVDELMGLNEIIAKKKQKKKVKKATRTPNHTTHSRSTRNDNSQGTQEKQLINLLSQVSDNIRTMDKRASRPRSSAQNQQILNALCLLNQSNQAQRPSSFLNLSEIESTEPNSQLISSRLVLQKEPRSQISESEDPYGPYMNQQNLNPNITDPQHFASIPTSTQKTFVVSQNSSANAYKFNDHQSNQRFHRTTQLNNKNEMSRMVGAEFSNGLESTMGLGSTLLQGNLEIFNRTGPSRHPPTSSATSHREFMNTKDFGEQPPAHAALQAQPLQVMHDQYHQQAPAQHIFLEHETTGSLGSQEKLDATKDTGRFLHMKSSPSHYEAFGGQVAQNLPSPLQPQPPSGDAQCSVGALPHYAQQVQAHKQYVHARPQEEHFALDHRHSFSHLRVPTQTVFNELRRTAPGQPQQHTGCPNLRDLPNKSSAQPAPVMFSEPRITNPSSPTTLDLHEQQSLGLREAHRGGPVSDLASLNCSNMFTMNNQFGSFNPTGNTFEQHDSRGGRLVPMTQTCTLTSSSAAAYDSHELLDERARQLDASSIGVAYQLNRNGQGVDKTWPAFEQPPTSNKDLMRIQDEGSDDEAGRELEQQRARSLSPQAYVSHRGNGCVQFNDTLSGQRLNKAVVGQAKAALGRSMNAPADPQEPGYAPNVMRLEAQPLSVHDKTNGFHSHSPNRKRLIEPFSSYRPLRHQRFFSHEYIHQFPAEDAPPVDRNNARKRPQIEGPKINVSTSRRRDIERKAHTVDHGTKPRYGNRLGHTQNEASVVPKNDPFNPAGTSILGSVKPRSLTNGRRTYCLPGGSHESLHVQSRFRTGQDHSRNYDMGGAGRLGSHQRRSTAQLTPSDVNILENNVALRRTSSQGSRVSGPVGLSKHTSHPSSQRPTQRTLPVHQHLDTDPIASRILSTQTPSTVARDRRDLTQGIHAMNLIIDSIGGHARTIDGHLRPKMLTHQPSFAGPHFDATQLDTAPDARPKKLDPQVLDFQPSVDSTRLLNKNSSSNMHSFTSSVADMGARLRIPAHLEYVE